jgi:hypothetical protein
MLNGGGRLSQEGDHRKVMFMDTELNTNVHVCITE